MLTHTQLDLPLKLLLVNQEYQFSNQKLMTLSGYNLGKYISKLKIGGNMWKSDDSGIYDFPNRMTVHFIMLRTPMKNRIGHNLNNTHFVSMNWRGWVDRSQTQLANLRTSSRHNTIFGLCKGFGYVCLLLTSSRDQVVIKKHTPSSSFNSSWAMNNILGMIVLKSVKLIYHGLLPTFMLNYLGITCRNWNRWKR